MQLQTFYQKSVYYTAETRSAASGHESQKHLAKISH